MTQKTIQINEQDDLTRGYADAYC